MPVSETLVAPSALRKAPGLPLALNSSSTRCFLTASPRRRASAIRLRPARRWPSPAARAALRAALSGHARARGQREQLQRLRKGLRSEPVELPFVVSVNGERTMLERLADALEATRGVKAAA